MPLPEMQVAEIEQIASAKFRSWEWRYGHSPKTDFRKTLKFPCGTVTANYSIKHGVLTEVSFEGDFIGSIPASELAEKIKGLRVEDLCNVPVRDYFDGVDDISVLFR